MSSSNFKGGKLKSAREIRAQLRHNARKNKTYSNKEIDPLQTPLNVNFTGLSYEELNKRLTEQLNFYDSLPGQNKRKDRVLFQEIVITRPKGLPADQESTWDQEAWQIFKEWNREFTDSDSNILYGYSHVDEIHLYKDARTQDYKLSRGHLHVGAFVVDDVGRFCGKDYSARKRIYALNNALQAMTKEKFGLKFMDGSQAKFSDSVEKLKVQSLGLEIEDKERFSCSLDKQIELKETKLKEMDEAIKDAASKYSKLELQSKSFWEQLWDLIVELLRGIFNEHFEERLPEIRERFEAVKAQIIDRETER